MKNNLLTPITSLCLLLAADASRAQLYWDPTLSGGPGGGGAGTWNQNSTANWYNGYTGSGDVKWTDNSAYGTNQAVFGNTAGTVTLSSTLSASNIQFTVAGYTLSGSGRLQLGAGGIDASSLGSGTVTVGVPLTLLPGQQQWQVGSGGTLAVNSVITRNSGAAVDFSASGISSTSAALVNDASGIIGGWATVGAVNSASGGDWAMLSGGSIAAYSSYTAISDTAASSQSLSGTSAQNWLTGGSGGYATTITASGTVNSIVQQGDITLNSGVTLTLGDGALLLRGVSRWMLAGSTTTSFLTSGSATGELFVDVPNSGATDWTIWPIITNNGTTSVSLVKNGAGWLKLRNINGYSGNTTVNGGVLAVTGNANGSQGVSTVGSITPFGTGSVLANSSEILLGCNVGGNNFKAMNISNPITLNNSILYEDDAFFHLQGTLTIAASGATLGATFDNSGDALDRGFAKGLFIDGTLAGIGPITVQDSGIETVNAWDSSCVYVTSINNPYSGAITVNPWTAHGGSYLFITGTNSLQYATINVTGDNGTTGRFGTPALLFGSGTNLDGAGYTTIGALAGSGDFVLANTLVTQSSHSTGAAFALAAGYNNTSSAYSGVMSGAGSFTKLGTGTLTLSGANTYTGNTTIQGGTLALSGSIASTNITVAAGATYDVSGVGGLSLTGNQTLTSGGTIIGSVNTASGTKLYVGTDGGYGTNNCINDLTLAAGALVYMDVGTRSTGSNDLVIVGGNLNVSGNVIHLKAPASATLQAADYTLIKCSNSISGTFAGAVWDVAPVNAGNFSIVTGSSAVTLHYTASTAPTGNATVSATNVVRNQTVLITVTTTNGTGGTVNSVVMDASPVGGSASLALVSAGGNKWTNSVTVTPDTTTGSKTLGVTISDTASLTGIINIALNVVVGNDVWNGAGADNNFDTNLNWTNKTAPGYVGDSLEFAGTTRLSPSVDQNYTITSLTFDAGAGSFNLGAGGGSLTLGSGLTNNSANTQTITAPVALGGAQSFNTAAGNVTVAGVVSGSGNLSKTGNGTLTLTASGSSWTGFLDVLGGTLNLNGATITSGSSGVSYVGYLTNSGNMTINGGSFTTSDELRVGGSDLNGSAYNATGSLTVSGGATVSVGRLVAARGNNNVNTVAGTITVNSGTLSSENDILLGFAGNNNLGKVVINSGGTVNIATTTKRWVIMSQWDTADSEVDVNGGQLNINAGTDIRFATGNNSGTNTFNLNSGAVTFYSDNGSTVGGTGVVDLHQGSGACINAFNLNGGILTVGGVTVASSGGTEAFNFNGGTLKAGQANSAFISMGSAVANVRSGGAIIDDGGYAIVAIQPLVHSTISGDNAVDGGLTKLGIGSLTFMGTNTYTGGTTISNGTLALGSSGYLAGTTNIQVGSGATFDVSAATAFTLGSSQSLSGSGTINGSVATTSGSKLYAGTYGTYGTNTFNNDLNLASGVVCYLDVGTAYNGDNDQIIVNGALTANGNVIHLKAPSTSSSLDTTADYVLFNAPNTTITGSFAAAPVWDVAPANASHFSIVTSANSVTLHYSATTATPTVTSVTATPSSVLRNQTARISASVVQGSAPIASVVLDLSSLGDGTVTMVKSNNTSVYTNSVTIPATISAGSYGLTVTATDTSSFTGSGSVSLPVNTSTETWNGGGGNANWSANANWSSGSAPGYAGDTLAFGGTANLAPNMDTNYTINGLSFNNSAGNFTLDATGGNTLTLTANGIVNNSAHTETLNLPVVFSSPQAISAASGNLVLSSNVDNGGNTLTVGGASNVLVSGVITDSGALSKTGSGTLILSGINTFTGPTAIGGGTVSVMGGDLPSPSSGVAGIIVGSGSGSAVLSVSSGTVEANTSSGEFSAALAVGNASGSFGETLLTGGSLTANRQIVLGTAAGAYGGWTQTGGSASTGTGTGGFLVVAGGSATGVFNQSGGSFTIGYNAATSAAGDANAVAVMNLSGGTFTSTATSGSYSTAGGLCVGEFGRSELNVSGSASVILSGNFNLLVGRNSGSSGTVNLLGGTVSTTQVTPGSGTNVLNFNGGTLQASANNNSFMTGLGGAYVYSGGAVIDSGANTITIGQALLAPAGYGVVSIPVTSGGSGYVDQPIVTITNISASGSGATAVANVVGGSIISITVTCPGHGYASGNTLGVALSGGGGSGAIIGTPVLGALTSGGLTKQGSGTLNLTGANTYTGNTTVNAGMLELANPVATNSTVTIASGATLQLDFATTNQVAALVLGGVSQSAGVYNSTTTSYITGTGSLLIAGTYATNPTNVTFSVSTVGSTKTLNLGWPADHLGWILQAQTNTLGKGLGTNWVDVPGSSSVTNESVTVGTGTNTPSVFYRLRKP